MALMTSGLLALIMTSAVNMVGDRSTEMGSKCRIPSIAAEFLDKCNVRWKEDSYVALVAVKGASEHVVLAHCGESQSHLQESSLTTL